MAESGERLECTGAGRHVAGRQTAVDLSQVTWRKSSWGTYNGNCVEVAWRKSSWSACNGNCVEIAELGGWLIGVRDTKDTGSGPVLVFDDAAWRLFLDGVKNGG
jgi:hypothetical protein